MLLGLCGAFNALRLLKMTRFVCGHARVCGHVRTCGRARAGARAFARAGARADWRRGSDVIRCLALALNHSVVGCIVACVG